MGLSKVGSCSSTMASVQRLKGSSGAGQKTGKLGVRVARWQELGNPLFSEIFYLHGSFDLCPNMWILTLSRTFWQKLLMFLDVAFVFFSLHQLEMMLDVCWGQSTRPFGGECGFARGRIYGRERGVWMDGSCICLPQSFFWYPPVDWHG